MAKKPWIFGKNVLISGASSGIGLELSKLLVCKYSCHVVGLARNEAKLQKAKTIIDDSKVKGDGLFDYLPFDVTGDWKELKTKLDEMNFGVDILINNAGIILPFAKAEGLSEDEVRRVFESNFFSHIKSYYTFEKVIAERKGAIVNIASSAGVCPVIGQSVYSASKSAVKSFTQIISEEHKKDIFISCVCPGFTSTDLFHEEMKGLVKKISMPAEKMAKKIVGGLKRKKRFMVIGKDAHAMSALYRLAPSGSISLISGVLKSSHNEMFDKVFNNKGV